MFIIKYNFIICDNNSYRFSCFFTYGNLRRKQCFADRNRRVNL